MVRVVALVFATLLCGCVGNVCEQRRILEEDECFPELDQTTHVEDDECIDTDRVKSRCAVRNDADYCEYYLWENRGAARREGYVVADYLPPGNEYRACLQEAGYAE